MWRKGESIDVTQDNLEKESFVKRGEIKEEQIDDKEKELKE